MNHIPITKAIKLLKDIDRKLNKLSETFYSFEKSLDLVDLCVSLYSVSLYSAGPFPVLTVTAVVNCKQQSQGRAWQHLITPNLLLNYFSTSWEFYIEHKIK